MSFQNCSKISPQEMSNALAKQADEDLSDDQDNHVPVPEVDSDEDIPDVGEQEPPEDHGGPNPDPQNPPMPSHGQCDHEGKEFFRNYCRSNRHFTEVSGTVVENHRGKRKYEITNLDTVYNLSGKHLFKGKLEDSQISEIRKVHGSLILCNVKVLKMSEGYGGVVVVDSHIEQVLSHHGNIRLIDSSIGSVENLRGRVIENK